MSMHIFYKYKQLVSVCLVAVILSGLYTPFLRDEAVPRAEAFFASLGNFATEATQLWTLVEDRINVVKNTITSGATVSTAASAGGLFLNDTVFDGIFFNLAQQVLKNMVASIVQWINSGFEGSPAFVTDLKGFLLQAADEVAGEFIYYELGLDFLCSPFKLDIQIALALQYQAGKDFDKARCTLSEVVDNIDNFLTGSFSDGGWQGWFELTAKPQNNTPAGAFLTAEGELQIRILDAQNREVKKLAWGNGFLSTAICDEVQGNNGPHAQENCLISTPGKVIQEALTFSLSTGPRSLLEAQDINQIISALFAQLAQKAITGVGGLLGLTNNNYSNDGSGESYLTRMTAEAAAIRDGNQLFGQALNNQRDFIAVNQDMIELVNDAELYNERAKERSKVVRPIFGGGDQIIGAEEEVPCYAVELPSTLERARETASTSIVTAEAAILALEDLKTRFESATDPEVQLSIAQEFTRLQAEDVLVDEIDVQVLDVELQRFERYDIEDKFKKEIAAEVERCQKVQDEINGNTGPGGGR